VSRGDKCQITCGVLAFVCVEISCPPRQFNGGCIETVPDGNLIGLHLPHTATAKRKVRETRGSRAIGQSMYICTQSGMHEHTYTHTDGLITLKHNACSPINWISYGVKIYRFYREILHSDKKIICSNNSAKVHRSLH